MGLRGGTGEAGGNQEHRVGWLDNRTAILLLCTVSVQPVIWSWQTVANRYRQLDRSLLTRTVRTGTRSRSCQLVTSGAFPI